MSTFFNSSTSLLSTFSNFLTKFRFFYFLSTFFNSSTCLFSTFFNSSTCLLSTFSYLLSKFSLFEFIYFSNSLLTKLYTQKTHISTYFSLLEFLISFMSTRLYSTPSLLEKTTNNTSTLLKSFYTFAFLLLFFFRLFFLTI